MRTMLYQLARLLGDLNALLRGKLPQRLVRRYLLTRSGSFINRITK